MRPAVLSVLFLSVCALADNWPQWRGPSHNGLASGAAPVTWNSTEHIQWKATIPGRGHSTPVIWENRIFLTTAVPSNAAAAGGSRDNSRGPGGGAGSGAEHRFVLMCLDRQTGKVLWERTVKTATPHEGYHQMYGSFASNSPVTDGKHVWAFFGSRGIFCFDLEGKLAWSKDVPPLKMRLEFGEGTAPTLAGDRIILNFDQEGGSYIIALDKNSGKQLWRQDRDEPSAWSQPLVVRHQGKDQVIVAATNRVRSYDLETGKLIWECGGLGGNVIPAPVERDGVVYVMSGFRNPNMLAIKLGREGDLTGTDAVLWTNQRGNSYTASPVLDGDKLYVITDNGMLSCFDVKTGKPFYHLQRLPKPYNFKASPVAAGGRLYLATEEGDVVVVKMGEKFEVLATNTLADEFFIASPVVVDGTMFLRGRNTLYSIR